MLNQMQFPLEYKAPYEVPSFVREGVERYHSEKGLAPPDWDDAIDRQVDPQLMTKRARQYDTMPAHDDSPETMAAFEAARTDILDQYEFLTRPEAEGGMGVTVQPMNTDPYHGFPGADPDDPMLGMIEDLKTNRNIRVWDTPDEHAHPYFSNEENTKLRAVHDVFGHVASGRGVSRHGEEAVARVHLSGFSPEAAPALETEFRGQNAYLNYGPTGDFGEQKLGLVANQPTYEGPRQLKYHDRRYRQGTLF